MPSDGYALFTECHRPYIQGVRRVLRERLEAAYGDAWFERGVLSALTDKQRENLSVALENKPATDRANLLDAPYFGRIINRNHAAAFADAFTDVDVMLGRFRFLSTIRNEWAHVSPDGLPIPRVASAIYVMKEILVRLRCREALEIETIMGHRNIEQPEAPVLEPISSTEDSDIDDIDDGSDEPTDAPLELWHTLQSYLVVESFVESSGGESEELAGVTVRVSNVSPTSEDRPEVCFRNVTLWSSVRSRGRNRIPDGFSLEPGKSVASQFTFYVKELANVEFRVSGDVDMERFFRFQRKGRLPGEVVQPLLKEFSESFGAIGVKEPLVRVLASVTAIQPTMTLADALLVRKELEQVKPLIAEKQNALDHLYREFHLSGESPLGAQCSEVARFLHGLGANIQAVDDAIGGTDLEAIKLAVGDLEQLQLSVLQLEETIRTMLNA